MRFDERLVDLTTGQFVLVDERPLRLSMIYERRVKMVVRDDE